VLGCVDETGVGWFHEEQSAANVFGRKGGRGEIEGSTGQNLDADGDRFAIFGRGRKVVGYLVVFFGWNHSLDRSRVFVGFVSSPRNSLWRRMAAGHH